MRPHFTPKRAKCSTVVYDCAALESLPDSVGPAAARRWAFTVMSADITMNQTNRMPLHILLVTSGVSGQPVTKQAAPEKSPGLSAP